MSHLKPLRSRRPHSLRFLFLPGLAVGAIACAPPSHEGLQSVAQSATAPTLGTTAAFAVLAGSTVTNTGSTVVTGNLGVEPGSAVTGFPPGIVIGGTEAGTAAALQAQKDATTAYNALTAQSCDQDLTGKDLGGLTLTPGTYCFSSSAQLTGTLILNGQGDPAAVFIFKIGSTLTTASHSSVMLINGASPCSAYWQVGSSATFGTTSTFLGTVIALTDITLTTGVTLSGRALARNGAVTLDTNAVSAATCESGVDAGQPDSGGQADAGHLDAGQADAGPVNAGDASDGGTEQCDADGGSNTDAAIAEDAAAGDDGAADAGCDANAGD